MARETSKGKSSTSKQGTSKASSNSNLSKVYVTKKASEKAPTHESSGGKWVQLKPKSNSRRQVPERKSSTDGHWVTVNNHHMFIEYK